MQYGVDIMLEGKGSIMESNGRVWIYIPTKIASDSAFPFKKGDSVVVKVDPRTKEIRISKK
jgi:hypothetical protein